MPTGQRALFQVAAQLTSDVSIIFFNHHFALELQGTGGSLDSLVASTPFHAFVNNQMTLGVAVFRQAGTDMGIASAALNFSGYLVDCGAGPDCPLP